jgi:hypothetical protein
VATIASFIALFFVSLLLVYQHPEKKEHSKEKYKRIFQVTKKY